MLTREQTVRYRYRADQDFFLRPEIQELVVDLAECPDLAIFLGAGASVAQGLPTWSELLLKMLMFAARSDDGFKDDTARDAWANAILHGYDPAAAASVLRSHFSAKHTFRDKLHSALYGRSSGGSNPIQSRGSDRFSRAVWELVIARRKRGLKTAIYTLNYDDYLERTLIRSDDLGALAKEAGITAAVPVHSQSQLAEAEASSDTVAIYHLHGYLPFENYETRSSERFVLSTSDYGTDWHDDWTTNAIKPSLDSTWLMMGLSLQDPHIGNLLKLRQTVFPHRTPRAFGVISAQGRPWRDLTTGAGEQLALAEQARLSDLDLVGIVSSYFFQDFQFLHEIALKAATPATKSYGERRALWYSRLNGKAKTYRSMLERKHVAVVGGLLQELRRALEELRPPAGADERIKVELWIRDVTDRGLRLLASSEIEILDFARAPMFPLSPVSDLAGIRALTQGAPRTHDREESQRGTWRSFAAFPLYLTGEPYWELPAGTLVLASTLRLRNSTLERQGTDVAERIAEFQPQIVGWLTPKKSRLPDLLTTAFGHGGDDSTLE